LPARVIVADHVPDGDRPLFLQDAFRVEGKTTDASST